MSYRGRIQEEVSQQIGRFSSRQKDYVVQAAEGIKSSGFDDGGALKVSITHFSAIIRQRLMMPV